MNSIAASSPTAGLHMDLQTGNPVELSLDDFEDEDLSEILCDNDLQGHAHLNINFKISRKSFYLQRWKSNKKLSASSKRKETQMCRSASVSNGSSALKGTSTRRPRPTSLNFFCEPARPGPLPNSYLVELMERKKKTSEATVAEQNSSQPENFSSLGETRLKPTYSDDTITNNNVDVENYDPSTNAAVKTCNDTNSLSHNMPKKKTDILKESTRFHKPEASSKSFISSCASQASRRTRLIRSASEWSIDDPEKVEYCFINGEFKEQTHTALFKFVPRHEDEILLEVNDSLHVINQADDFWYEGINMRTGKQGIFPSYYAQSLMDVVDRLSDISIKDEQTEKFNIYFLGSVEVPNHKGNDILCQAMYKVAHARRATIHTLPPVLVCLVISSTGIKMMDQSLFRDKRHSEVRLQQFSSSATIKQHIHFFHLRNVSFCGHHPKNDKYFAFITRHPESHSRFACHVFVSEVSTRPLAESIGRAFVAFYHSYMNASHPAEDIYIEE